MAVLMRDMILKSGVNFGTSGARGLVSDMTDKVCYVYTKAFIQYCSAHYNASKIIAVAGDLRPSTERILSALAQAAKELNTEFVYCGRIPSPAIALYGIDNKIPTIMVTGSHIPDDRNGIKFNHPMGEITKKDEEGILSQSVDIDESLFDASGMLKNPPSLPPVENKAIKEYTARYSAFFGTDALMGLTLGVYQHSAVGRDTMVEVLESLGAYVKPLARSEQFIPVDTEAIRPEDEVLAKKWAIEGFDAIVSTDGDSDRPLLADDSGEWFRGDVLGILAAKALGINRVATPVSCNTALEKCEAFEKISRTRIGSPYVIAGMESLCEKGKTVAGYEANGGFLLATSIEKEGRVLNALPTRDALLPVIAVLAEARAHRQNVSDLLRHLPKRYTSSDRLKEFPTERSRQILEKIKGKNLGESLFGKFSGKLISIDETDGYRMVFDSEEVIHLRPSGNAPEFRCYVETASAERSKELLAKCLALMSEWVNANGKLGF